MKLNVRFPKLTDWQQDTIDIAETFVNKGKTIVVKSSRQKGKSFLICCLALKRALRKKLQTVIVVSPSNAQNARIFKQIKAAISNTPILKSANGADLIITLYNDSEIIFKSAEQRDRLRGYTATSALIVDEAAFISEEIYQIIHPFATKHRAEIFLFSTPLFHEGTFFNLWMQGITGANKDVISIDWCNSDMYDFSDFITDEQMEYYRKIYAPLKYKCEILGEFISDKSFVFGNFMDCVGTPDDDIPVYAGIDWATGVGNDSTVVTFMNSAGEVTHIWNTNTMDTNEQITTIADMLNSFPTLKTVVVEKNSIGKVFYDGIIARLKNRSILKAFTTSNKSKRDIVEAVITAFQNRKILIPHNEELFKQLSSFEVQKTGTGYTYNNARPDVHDDFVISLCLAYYAKTNKGTGSFGFAS